MAYSRAPLQQEIEAALAARASAGIGTV